MVQREEILRRKKEGESIEGKKTIEMIMVMISEMVMFANDGLKLK